MADVTVQFADDGPELAVTYGRYLVGDSPVTIAAGALRVSYTVVAAGVTCEGVDVPQGAVVQHGMDGFRTPALDFVISGSGEVFVVEERAV